MTLSKRVVAAWLLLVGLVGALAAHGISDSSGARLQLAPLFVAAALGAAALRLRRAGSRSRRRHPAASTTN